MLQQKDRVGWRSEPILGLHNVYLNGVQYEAMNHWRTGEGNPPSPNDSADS